MGIPFLLRDLQKSNARLPLKITFNDANNSETECDLHVEKYREIGCGQLKSIGIDGSVFLHSHIVSKPHDDHSAEQKTETNNGDYIIIKNIRVYVEASAEKIVSKVMNNVVILTIFFHHFNTSVERSKTNVIIHFVVDGKPPVPKNRKVYKSTQEDCYSLMSNPQKDVLHNRIIDKLTKSIALFNRDSEIYNLILLSNEQLSYHERGEGELVLYSLCRDINKKYKFDPTLRHVIVSPDSDVTAMMILNRDPTLVVVSTPSGGETPSLIFISNRQLICDGLNLSPDQLIIYTILHFIFFGSDYNLGLVTSPCESKKKIIYDSVRKNEHNLNAIGKQFKRRVSKDNKESAKVFENVTEKDSLLNTLKDLLVIEGLCSIMYYKHFGEKKYLLDDSPLLYADFNIKQYIALLSFD